MRPLPGDQVSPFRLICSWNKIRTTDVLHTFKWDWFSAHSVSQGFHCSAGLYSALRSPCDSQLTGIQSMSHTDSRTIIITTIYDQKHGFISYVCIISWASAAEWACERTRDKERQPLLSNHDPVDGSPQPYRHVFITIPVVMVKHLLRCKWFHCLRS